MHVRGHGRPEQGGRLPPAVAVRGGHRRRLVQQRLAFGHHADVDGGRAQHHGRPAPLHRGVERLVAGERGRRPSDVVGGLPVGDRGRLPEARRPGVGDGRTLGGQRQRPLEGPDGDRGAPPQHPVPAERGDEPVGEIGQAQVGGRVQRDVHVGRLGVERRQPHRLVGPAEVGVGLLGQRPRTSPGAGGARGRTRRTRRGGRRRRRRPTRAGGTGCRRERGRPRPASARPAARARRRWPTRRRRGRTGRARQPSRRARRGRPRPRPPGCTRRRGPPAGAGPAARRRRAGPSSSRASPRGCADARDRRADPIPAGGTCPRGGPRPRTGRAPAPASPPARAPAATRRAAGTECRAAARSAARSRSSRRPPAPGRRTAARRRTAPRGRGRSDPAVRERRGGSRCAPPRRPPPAARDSWPRR